jgi:glycosyltransferase involved in cell wall biosynthesis
MDGKPRAAVIIPTRNRIESLGQVIESVLRQSVPAEIFVMDDGSTDQTESVISKEFPQVQYHKQSPGKGPTFERNKAARLTEAEVLFTIDDDCIMDSPKTIEDTLTRFDHPRIGAVTIPFVNVLQEDKSIRRAAPDSSGIWTSLEYSAGMVAIRREPYLAIGGYREYIFMQGEERDLAIRLLNQGYVVRLGDCQPLKHLESPLRNWTALHIRGARNNLLFCFYNVPWPDFPVRLASTTFLNLRHGIKIGHPFTVFRGVIQGYYGMLHELSNRRPVPRNIYHLARQLQQKDMKLQDYESALPPLQK